MPAYGMSLPYTAALRKAAPVAFITSRGPFRPPRSLQTLEKLKRVTAFARVYACAGTSTSIHVHLGFYYYSLSATRCYRLLEGMIGRI